MSLFPLPTDRELQNIYTGYADRKDRISVENERRDSVYSLKLEKLRRFAQGNRLLDIGAGLGTFVAMARDFGFDAIGVDYEKDQCERARELWGVNLINDKIENIYEGLGRFDIVNMHHVLEHVHSPKQIFNILQEILEPAGIVLVEVPNQFFKITTEIRNRIGVNIKPPVNALHHLYFFSAKSLKCYIDKDEFEIIEFNQFRPRTKKLPIWQRMPKDFYRLLTNTLGIGGGNFFEFYIRKKTHLK